MSKLLLLSLILTSLLSSAHAFTLNNNFGASFGHNRVKVSIAGDTTCATAGMTIYELQDLIDDAMAKFWNRVPTSALELVRGGFTDTINNINTGKLCAPTDDDCITAAAGTVIPPVNDIVVACNNLPGNYGGGNVLAVTIPNNFAGRRIKGAVILINESSVSFSLLTRSGKIAVLAHEIGHAIGLGHTDQTDALMYYKTVTARKALGQDDMDGASYLYPKKFDGCGLYKGTIVDGGGNIDPMSTQLFIGFFFVLLFARIRKLFKRPQARPAF